MVVFWLQKIKIFYKKNNIFLFLILLFFAQNNSYAEIVSVKKETKNFGEWKSFCETDTMMNATHCRLGAKFFDNASVIAIEPSNQFFSQFFITIPKIRLKSLVQIRVDNNDLIFSRDLKKEDFGLIALTDEQKKTLFAQMKNGEFLFLRFNISDSDKEITAKINLVDFQNAIFYAQNQQKSK